jgi:nucleotide-binding universal stress UspA family protein
MISTILVPLDGSELAERALPIADDLARRLSARLLLIRSVHPTTPSPSAASGEDLAVVSARRYLEMRKVQLAASGREVQAILCEGEAADQILNVVRTRAVDLIVMTRHGRSEGGRWLIGSVTAEVLRRTRVPVVLVPLAAPPISADERLVILVALDGSALGEAALAPSAKLAAQLGARVVLFRPVSPDSSGSTVSEAQLWEAREYLTNVARRLTPVVRRLAVRTASGLLAVAIPRAALETGADLISLTTRRVTDTETALMLV